MIDLDPTNQSRDQGATHNASPSGKKVERGGKAIAHLIPPLLVFVSTFLVYLKTLAPTLTYGGDCGELISSACVLGIAHPPGYPLFMLLAKASMILPVGDIAYRVNLLCALFAALTVLLLYLIAYRITRQVVPALVAAWSLGFSYFFWSEEAVKTDVHTFQSCALCGVVLLLLKWRDTREERWLCWAALTLGLGFTTHMSIGLILPAVLVFLTVHDRAFIRRPWLVVKLLGLMLLPLLLYLYLPLRTAHQPVMQWGDLSTWTVFRNHVTAKLYRPHMFAFPLWRMPGQVAKYFHFLLLSFFFTGPLALAGMLHLTRRDWRAALLLWTICFFNAAFFINYDVGNLQVFFIPSYLMIALFAGAGAAALMGGPESPETRRRIAAPLSIALVLMQLTIVFPVADMSQNRRAFNDTEEILRLVEPNGLLMTDLDETYFSLKYFQVVRGERKDISVYHKNTALRETGKSWRRIVRENLGRRPMYLAMYDPLAFEKKSPRFFDPPLDRPYFLVPLGPLVRMQTTPPPVVAVKGKIPRQMSALVGDHLLLRGCRFSTETVKKGKLFTVSLFWEPTAKEGKDFAVELCLDPRLYQDGKSLNEWVVKHPLACQQWVPGKVYRDDCAIEVDDEKAVPGDYQVVVMTFPNTTTSQRKIVLGNIKVVNR